ncbi:MAG: Usg family protein [Alphaproteobacteria bacterium]|nr:Usg family protein [Alphaproteobacteria bacterium]
MRESLSLQLAGWRLTTAEIVYHLPNHPGLLQTFVWQTLDLAPKFPRLRKFLDFWSHNIEGRLYSVNVAHAGRITAGKARKVDFLAAMH